MNAGVAAWVWEQLLSPDGPMPDQLPAPRPGITVGVRNLHYMILKDAMNILRKASKGARYVSPTDVRDDVEWFLGNIEALVPFTQCCTVLGLDPGAVLAGLQEQIAAAKLRCACGEKGPKVHPDSPVH